ncbi:MAG: hypothetical protein KA758_06840 [Acidimicrobiales bacterium]|nr:hypothetical protein [Acidimicrobiales bacterium]
MTAPEWRDCADPDELAAAVAAGVEVLRMRNRGEWSRSVLSEPKDFAFRIGRGDRYRVPDGWSPEPPADDLRERIARAAAGGYMRVPIVALDGMYLGPPWLDVADAVLAVLPTPPPTPPWPGAVLSGLCDEDGQPTWLAQAGQVRGEQVRIWHDEPWVTTHGSWADSRWVEVRAPRAVPEPETERVPWWEVVADQRRLVGFPEVGGTRYGADGCLAFTDHDGVLLANVHDPAIGWDGSGTVEVLSEDP